MRAGAGSLGPGKRSAKVEKFSGYKKATSLPLAPGLRAEAEGSGSQSFVQGLAGSGRPQWVTITVALPTGIRHLGGIRFFSAA